MCQEVRGGKGQRERRCVVSTDRQPPTALGPTGNLQGFYVWRGNLAAAWRRPAREPGIAYGILRGIPVRPVRLWRASRRHQKLPITRHRDDDNILRSDSSKCSRYSSTGNLISVIVLSFNMAVWRGDRRTRVPGARVL